MKVLAVCAVALLFGFVGSMPLAGPIAVLVLSRAAERRFAEAIRIAIGAAVAEAIYAGLAFWGFTTTLGRLPLVVPVSRGATAAVLLALGVRFAFWKPDGKKASPRRGAGTFVGFSISAINPTLVLTWSAAVAFLYGRGLTGASAHDAVPFGLCAALGIASWFLILVALLRRYKGKLPQAAFKWTVRGLGMILAVGGAISAVDLARWIASHR